MNNKKFNCPVYQVKGKVSNTDTVKTIIVEELNSPTEAMDYAAIFHSIDEIEFIKQGRLEKGVFIPSQQPTVEQETKYLYGDTTGVCYNCLNGFHEGCDSENCTCKGKGHKARWWKTQKEIDIEQLAEDMFHDQFKSDLVHGYKEPMIQLMKDYAAKANTVNKELFLSAKKLITDLDNGKDLESNREELRKAIKSSEQQLNQ